MSVCMSVCVCMYFVSLSLSLCVCECGCMCECVSRLPRREAILSLTHEPAPSSDFTELRTATGLSHILRTPLQMASDTHTNTHNPLYQHAHKLTQTPFTLHTTDIAMATGPCFRLSVWRLLPSNEEEIYPLWHKSSRWKRQKKKRTIALMKRGTKDEKNPQKTGRKRKWGTEKARGEQYEKMM